MTIKEKLQQGQPVVGPFIKACSPALIEILGLTGFDYALLDMEHSPVSVEQLEHLVRAAETTGLCPFVRASGISEAEILHPLDKGAVGLLVPMVNTKAEAEQVVHCAKYAPVGARGMDIYARSARYGAIPKAEYFAKANQETILAVQIEGTQGLENLDDILKVAQIDIVYIGPYDLSQSLGIPGQVQDPRVVEKIEVITTRTKESGKCVGIYVDDVETAKRYIDLGIQFITLSVDTTMFFQTCKTMIADIRPLRTTSNDTA